jgi:hypothetical protein
VVGFSVEKNQIILVFTLCSNGISVSRIQFDCVYNTVIPLYPQFGVASLIGTDFQTRSQVIASSQAALDSGANYIFTDYLFSYSPEDYQFVLPGVGSNAIRCNPFTTENTTLCSPTEIENITTVEPTTPPPKSSGERFFIQPILLGLAILCTFLWML